MALMRTHLNVASYVHCFSCSILTMAKFCLYHAHCFYQFI